MKYLLAIIIAAAAMIESIWYRHKHREEAEQYASTTKLISGIGFIIAVAGIIINECGVRGGAYILIFGFILEGNAAYPCHLWLQSKTGEGFVCDQIERS